jgi:hypothetical protein
MNGWVDEWKLKYPTPEKEMKGLRITQSKEEREVM